MSRQAIAAALAHDGLSIGERLVAFSLASFADRDGRARPGTPAAAARAGLKRSWFLEARDRLERRGLAVVEDAATGRGHASTLRLPFAQTGPWWEGEINPWLFESVLGYSRSQGAARLLLGAMAALADEQRVVEAVTTSQLCAAAGFSDRTYRRAQAALLAAGELVVRKGAGGRGNTNSWEIWDPRSRAGEAEPAARRRVAPPPGQRPLTASVSSRPAPAAERRGGTGDARVGEDLPVVGGKGGGDRTVSGPKRPATAGVSVVKGGADRTVPRETPAETPAKTPAPNARAGSEPQNPRTVHPPNPPKGGPGAESIVVEQSFVSERGRNRRRPVTIDLASVRKGFRAPWEADHAAWERVRSSLREAVSESMFEIWLAPVKLIAVDAEGVLILSAPPAIVSWLRVRCARLLERAGKRAGRALRIAKELERLAVVSGEGSRALHPDQSPNRPTDALAHSLAYQSSYLDVYTQTKEML